ncbi:MAG TPA: hypothetical protein VM368_02025, partial [Flavisolibacter sp.]|nr:hypothetical protein [Flavisolibacter sp.]
MNRNITVEECDATEAFSSNTAGTYKYQLINKPARYPEEKTHCILLTLFFLPIAKYRSTPINGANIMIRIQRV